MARRVYCGVAVIMGLCCSLLAAQERPNVLLIIADDWGRSDAGAYGNAWIKTPSFDRLAKEGLLFRNAYTPNAKCSPSRACVLTGRNPWQLEEAANHICYFPVEFPTYAEVLARRGLQVGMTGKGWAPGVAKDATGKPRAMTGTNYSRRSEKPPTKDIAQNDYAGNFADFLDDAQAGSPWVFWCGMHEPHRGYTYGSGIALGGKRLGDITSVPGCWPDTDVVRNDLLDYAFEVEHVDRHVGRMLAELEKRGVLDNTLIIMTSDNGMPFPRVKGSAYDRANHLPFVIRWPKGIVAHGVVVDDYVSLIDIAPTILDVLEVAPAQSGMAPITGQSLRPIFAAGRGGRIVPDRDHVLIGRERNDVGRPHDAGYPVRGMVSADGLLLINYEPARWPAGNPETGYLDTDGSPTKTAVLGARKSAETRRFWDLCFGKRPKIELYDLATDSECLVNLADSSQPRVGALTQRLERQLTSEGDPRMLGTGDLFDQYPHATEGNRGFYERWQRGEKPEAGWVNPSDFESDVSE